MNLTPRHLVASLVLLGCCAGLSAQNAVAVHQKDGTVATFAFSEKPVVTYMGNDLVLTTAATSVSYPIYLLQKIDFDVVWDDLADVKSPNVQFSFRDDELIVTGGEPGSLVAVHTVGGMKVGQCRLDANGRAAVSVRSFGKDSYVVTNKCFTFKFQRP